MTSSGKSTNGDRKKKEEKKTPTPSQSTMAHRQQPPTSSGNRKERLRREFDVLSKEMEIAQHASVANGQLKKKVPREQSVMRTRKRKLLERDDYATTETHVDARPSRLRGSKIAFEDEVIHGSVIFGRAAEGSATTGAVENTIDYVADDQGPPVEATNADSDEDIVEDVDNHSEPASDNDVDDDEDEDENDNDDEQEDNKEGEEIQREASSKTEPSKRPSVAEKTTAKPKRRRMYRLRNFKSYRMAQRHGEALGAHARGQNALAVQKLKAIAKDAPSAPQVYSSLGMVYEDMLHQSRRSITQSPHQSEGPEQTTTKQSLDESIGLATKAYGSYHIAAVLCKKDYSLWVRAADCANAIANMHVEAIDLNPDCGTMQREWHHLERQRWLEEAKHDYHTADNLKPPGVDVAAKLASIHMELGNLSEALTLLTDLKNASDVVLGFQAWLLYAELMLRIGHECLQWNRGIQTNENYMFRRWLRKWSKEFDWQERRLQALSLALEAAAGSNSCAKYLAWIQHRAEVRHSAKEGNQRNESDSERWHVEYNEPALNKEDNHTYSIPEQSDNQRIQNTVDNDLSASSPEGMTSTSEIDHVPNEYSNQPPPTLSTVKDVSKQESADVRVDEDTKDQQGMSTSTSFSRIPREEGIPNESEGTSFKANEESNGVPLNSSSQADLSSKLTDDADCEHEKEILLAQTKAQLLAFDRTTDDMALEPGSEAALRRQVARDELEQKSNNEVLKVADNFYDEGQQNASMNGESTNSTANVKGDSLFAFADRVQPISSSCKRVCGIASELLKHLLGSQLYDGGRLVGEAVSSFLKERSSLALKRIEARIRIQQRSQLLKDLAFQFETHEELHEEEESDDDLPFLSDDEELTSENGSGLLNSMRYGVLPPEISVLYSLCLIGENKRFYIAAKLIDAIDNIPQEPASWLLDDAMHTELSPEVLWHLFHRAMTEPLGRTAAYAFVADVLRKLGREGKWSEKLGDKFNHQLGLLESLGLFTELETLGSELPPGTVVRKSQVLKVLLAWGRLKIHAAENLAKSSGQDDVERASSKICQILERLMSYLPLIWKRKDDGEVSSSAIEVLGIFGRGYFFLARNCSQERHHSGANLRGIHNIGEKIISQLMGVEKSELHETEELEISPVHFVEMPFCASWQTERHKALSLQCYNLCVGFNVSFFSGWEVDEFNIRFMRRKSSGRFFGLLHQDNKVAGCLTTELEGELVQQWDMIKALLPTTRFDLEAAFGDVQSTPWYQDAHDKRNEAKENEKIDSCGEHDGILCFLSFSRSCLRLAKEAEIPFRDELILTALSILLPMIQFSLMREVWDSELGRASSSSSFNVWKEIALENLEAENRVLLNFQSSSSSNTRIRKPKPVSRPLDEWFSGEDQTSTFSNMVAIPAHELMKQWKNSEGVSLPNPQSNEAHDAMKRVHTAILQLRACYTEVAVEKASLQVAVALLDLLPDHAENPFTCLHQAAIFASHGTKGGSSDVVFRTGLPEEADCTPEQALAILGRAECFQAVYFPYEAAFLCSFVARVVSAHRDRQQPQRPWNRRWKVISVLCYNVSVMIRNTLRTVFDMDTKNEEFDSWEKAVIEELIRGRSDALTWKRTLERDARGVEQKVNAIRESIRDTNHGCKGPDVEEQSNLALATTNSFAGDYAIPSYEIDAFAMKRRRDSHDDEDEFSDLQVVSV